MGKVFNELFAMYQYILTLALNKVDESLGYILVYLAK